MYMWCTIEMFLQPNKTVRHQVYVMTKLSNILWIHISCMFIRVENKLCEVCFMQSSRIILQVLQCMQII